MDGNTVAIIMTALFQYLLITVKVVALEKPLSVIHKILRLPVNTLTGDEKHYLLTRENLTQTIQIQLSQKQKLFFNFFFHFQNLYSTLNIRVKNMTLISDVFLEILALKNIVK